MEIDAASKKRAWALRAMLRKSLYEKDLTNSGSVAAMDSEPTPLLQFFSISHRSEKKK
jgi:hypothetical protein